MGRAINKKGDPINGILLVDKASGVSSNQVLQSVKKLINAQKAGHTGSLDPIATGVLPICFGKATRISGFFLNADKRYVVTIKLGVKTDSGDSEGKVMSQSSMNLSEDQLQTALTSFKGSFLQTPPMYSAIKRNGQPLYKLARQGLVIEREARPVTVHELAILSFDRNFLTLDVFCSKGFYVRSLANDLGEHLGCGAHVTALRRTQVGLFTLDKCIGLGVLTAIEQTKHRQDLVFGVDFGLDYLPKAIISQSSIKDICQGRVVRLMCNTQSGLSRIYSEDEKFIGLGEVFDDRLIQPKRVLI